MADDAKERLARLLGGNAPAGQLSGATPRQIDAGKTHQPPAQQQGNVRIIYITDATVSMFDAIEAVRGVIRDVGNHVLSADLQIEAAAMGFDEHAGYGFTPAMLKAAQYDEGVTVHRDFLQINPFTTSGATLEQQVAGIVKADEGNGTGDEPYECAAKYLVDLVQEDRATNPTRKYGVVIFGDSMPHGVPGASVCPYGVSPQELRTLATLANRTFWVDCDNQPGDGPFKLGTYEQVRGVETATYLRFRDAASILGEALTAMAEQTKGPAAYQAFLAQLPATTAITIKGLLGEPKQK